VCAADDENEACSVSAAPDITSFHILPNIDIPAGEPHDSLSIHCANVLHGVSDDCDIGCHKQDMGADTIADSSPKQKLLPSLSGSYSTYVSGVAVSDDHVTDSQPHDISLPSSCCENTTVDSSEGLADASAVSQPQDKLLPSLYDSSPTIDSADTLADTRPADSEPKDKLLPSL